MAIATVLNVRNADHQLDIEIKRLNLKALPKRTVERLKCRIQNDLLFAQSDIRNCTKEKHTPVGREQFKVKNGGPVFGV